MPTTSFTQDLIWFSNPLILFTCVYLLWKRGHLRNFPGFFCYLILVGIKAYVVYLLAKILDVSTSYSYFYIAWGLNLISIGLSLVALYEVVSNVLTSGTLKLSR